MPTSPEEKGFGQGDARLAAWAIDRFRPEDDVLREIRARGVREGLPPIAVGPMDGLHLEILARACNARRAVEVGTLAGYSGVCLLRGLAPGGTLDTFEFSPKHAEVARESFRRAGFESRVRIHVGPAGDNLPKIESQGPFDLVFIDADKPGYPAYLEWAAKNLRIGGIVLGDNAFAWGKIADPPDEQTRGLAEFNERLANDKRWRATMIPTAEGLAMGVRV